jgi:hypothetical protein
MLHAASINLEGVLGGADFIADMRAILSPHAGIFERRRLTALAANANAAVDRLRYSSAIVDRAAFYCPSDRAAVSRSYCNYQVGFSSVQDRTQPSPLQQGFFHIVTSSGIGHGLFEWLSRIRVNDHSHRRGS